MSSKMPAGFNAKKASEHLAGLGLGGGSVDSVFLHALAAEPATRLADEAKARAFLDECAQAYAALSGVSLSAGMPFVPFLLLRPPTTGRACLPSPSPLSANSQHPRVLSLFWLIRARARTPSQSAHALASHTLQAERLRPLPRPCLP